MCADPLQRLPQSGPARLVTRILDTAEGTTCLARVPSDSPFCVHHAAGLRAPALLAIEMAAQSAALLEPTSPGPSSNSPEERYLAGVRAVQLHTDWLDVELEYTCRSEPTTVAPPLRIYRFVVSAPGGEPVAEGEFSTFCGSTKESS